MANKNFNTRIINKHDTEENWSKATGFIPLEGEVVIYESDETHITPRLKVGDGETNINNLPFVETNGSSILNIKDSTGSSSLQQVQDTGYTGIAIKTKNPNAYALDSTLTDNEPIGATGAFASSFGGVTSAQGKRSFTCGTNTIAKGKYSFASGDNAVALGNESFVSGFTTVAKGSQSFAIGSVTQAIGQNSVSTGSNNISNGGNSFTGGQDCVTGENALRSFVYGKGLKALSNDAFVVGRFNQSGDELFEVGNGTSDTNRHTAFKVNNDGEVFADYLYTNSIVCQKFRVIDTGVWVGDYRVLTNNVNDIMPIVNSNLNLNNGSGTYSIIQKDNIAIAASSVALGINTQATAGASMSTGVQTQANGLHSFAAGNNSIAGYANQFIVGKFNSNKSDTYFEVGNGADANNRSNAFEVYTDGHAEISAMGSTEKSVTTKKYVDDKIAAIPGGGGSITVDQIYNAESENAQSGKAVAEAVSSRVPKKSANPGAPFPSVIVTSNSSYDENFIPTDDSYLCIDTVGAELGKNIDNYLSTFANSIPRRDSRGNLFTGTPIDEEDCANKKYVDDKVAVVTEAVSLKADITEVNQIKDDIAYKLDYKNPQKLTADQQLAIQSAIGILSVKEVLF